MPYQVLPGLAIITGMFTISGLAIGGKKLILRDDWDRALDARDMRLKDRIQWEEKLKAEGKWH
ncbi:hypothetical protein SPRG_12622 [Saprolegnia parasitica CBS 223.65]|uniref:NADH dehydrogenase [ubiquinone] 1 alpha subcomplex subunit 1 n=1 Tax=Saprolegnia parasitica (strain CBS 223.65) TaxID=695850 RepID=A0A067BTH0_SAPPC|nr:hypothetical protein SPRG_12622 [Saprolegnia parasitica CBS 223.65]KDO21804.1 hypothetical protein SPRG_12622 [Saprolegnia parasitica CBS 223.65]|eukprot:XP_012207482.1 hypothetical protein SPRG_12622 [Saprolegnia parasitica CBS 223.65]